MPVREITARTLLRRTRNPDAWFGVRYNMNLYRGCEHHCIYCDSRSLCYGIDDFDGELLVKANAVELLRRELARLRVKGIVGTGSMQDPYTPAEARLNMTGQALGALLEFGFPVHIVTKSDLVLRDAAALAKLATLHACVCFTVTTAPDALGMKLEPGAPLVSRRFAAARELASIGVQVGILMMPVLPLIGDTVENVTGIMAQAAASGAGFVVPWFGLTMRDRQREHFYRRLDVLFPGVRPRYERLFGGAYECASPDADRLHARFEELRATFGLGRTVRPWRPASDEQLSLFEDRDASPAT